MVYDDDMELTRSSVKKIFTKLENLAKSNNYCGDYIMFRIISQFFNKCLNIVPIVLSSHNNSTSSLYNFSINGDTINKKTKYVMFLKHSINNDKHKYQSYQYYNKKKNEYMTVFDIQSKEFDTYNSTLQKFIRRFV